MGIFSDLFWGGGSIEKRMRNQRGGRFWKDASGMHWRSTGDRPSDRGRFLIRMAKQSSRTRRRGGSII